jgi:hypothetical protein
VLFLVIWLISYFVHFLTLVPSPLINFGMANSLVRKHGLVLIGRNVFRTCEIIVSRFWLVDVNLERAFHINKTVRIYQYQYIINIFTVYMECRCLRSWFVIYWYCFVLNSDVYSLIHSKKSFSYFKKKKLVSRMIFLKQEFFY